MNSINELHFTLSALSDNQEVLDKFHSNDQASKSLLLGIDDKITEKSQAFNTILKDFHDSSISDESFSKIELSTPLEKINILENPIIKIVNTGEEVLNTNLSENTNPEIQLKNSSVVVDTPTLEFKDGVIQSNSVHNPSSEITENKQSNEFNLFNIDQSIITKAGINTNNTPAGRSGFTFHPQGISNPVAFNTQGIDQNINLTETTKISEVVLKNNEATSQAINPAMASNEHKQPLDKILPLNGKELPVDSADKGFKSNVLLQNTDKSLFSSHKNSSAEQLQSSIESQLSSLQQSQTLNKAQLQTQPQAALLQSQPQSQIDTHIPQFSVLSAEKTNSQTTQPLTNTLSTEITRQFTIEASAGSSEWNNHISSRVRWMNNANISSAEIQLNPAELGKLEIKISTEDDVTRVNFISNNAVTRDLLEASMPRLRDLLASSGLQLEQGDISKQEYAEDKTNTNDYQDNHFNDSIDEMSSELNSILIKQNNSNQIDHYV